MARKRKKNSATAGELNLTAMIDVAFQLLSFFVMTAHPVDVLTNLDVSRPSPDKSKPPQNKPPPVLTITVADEGYLVNTVPVDFAQLQPFIGRMAKADPTQTVLVQCDQRAMHSKLITALDMCTQAGLKNISVISANKVIGR